MILLTLILIIAVSQAKWSEPISVIDYPEFMEEIYPDDADITHITWCSKRDKKVRYRKLYTNMTMSKEIILDLNRSCLIKPSIASSDKGKTLYLSYNAYREDNSRILDAFYTESVDGGSTWSKPIAFPRANISDELNRFFLNVIVTKEKRVWIFYRTAKYLMSDKNLTSATGKITYIMRAPGSSIFNKEVITEHEADYHGFLYNVNFGKPTISIVFTTRPDEEFITSTTNNGISWTKPKKMYPCGSSRKSLYINPILRHVKNEKSFEFVISPFASPFGTQNIYFPCRIDDKLYVDLRITSDFGRSWRTVSIKKNQPFLTGFTFSKDADGDEIITYPGMITQSYMKTNAKEFIQLEPFMPGKAFPYFATAHLKGTKFMYWFIGRDLMVTANDLK